MFCAGFMTIWMNCVLTRCGVIEMQTNILIRIRKTGKIIKAMSYGCGAVDVRGNTYSKKSYEVLQVLGYS
jgi:hypothetical protein